MTQTTRSRRYLNISKLRDLEESCGFLSNWKDEIDPEIPKVITRTNSKDVDEELTLLFNRLAELNKERAQILEKMKATPEWLRTFRIEKSILSLGGYLS